MACITCFENLRNDYLTSTDIEVQMVDQHNMIQRALYYWAVQYRGSLPRGSAYQDLMPAVSLNILGFKLFEDNDEPFSSWGIYNAKTGERLTRDLSLNFLEVPKFAAPNKPRSEWTRMERWMCYFSDPDSNILTVEKKREILQMDATIAKALEATDQFFQNPVHRQMYWESERSRMDRLSNEKYYRQQGREEGLKEGREEGLKKGREEGLKEGREEGREEVAERMIVRALREQSVTGVARLLDVPVDYVKTIAVKNGVMTM